MEIGILSLSDLQTDSSTGTPRDAGRRTREIVSYAIAADQRGGRTSSASASTTARTSPSRTPPFRWPRSLRPPAASA